MNRWWISALIYSDSRFKSLVETHLRSFRTPNALSGTTKNTSFPQDEFDYARTIQEVLKASQPDRIVFLLWISAYGTGAKIKAFLSAGLDLEESDSYPAAYLRTSVKSGNLSTFQVLLSAGATDDNDLLREFTSSPGRGEDDIVFIDGLIPKTYPWDNRASSDDHTSYLTNYSTYVPWRRETTMPQHHRIVAQKLIASGLCSVLSSTVPA
ncbi:MAG: hypothetical protein FRX48_02473 [Lasallia pustulata]|uniref:Uncharacterized protein n=1 Tax=Lasallia pustulata TaxID=136370 RepID=A0A5M8PXH9_9LECA|nr:MAG: hypothetical protein FRX48_02473 [Lasallia pustulata]